MITALGLIYSMFITLAAGRLLFEVPALRMRDEHIGIRVPLYIMSGSLVISLYMFLLFFLSVRFSVISISAPFLIYSLYYCLKHHYELGPTLISSYAYAKTLIGMVRERANWIFMSALLLLTLVLISILIENLIIPIYIGDVYCMWFFKPKAMFLAKTIPLDLFTNINLWFNTYNYPLLTSLNVAWFAICIGKWSDTVTKTFYTMQYLATIVFFYYSLKRYLNSGIAMMGTFITFCVPHVIGDLTTGYVDLIVAFYGCMAVISLFNWMENKENPRDLYLSALFIGAAAWTHNEGLILFGALILTLFAYLFARIIAGKIRPLNSIKDLIIFFAIYGVIYMPFKALCWHFKLKEGWVSGVGQLFAVLPNLQRIPVIFGYFCYEFFLNTYLWLYFWIFLFVIVLMNRKSIARSNVKYVLLFVFFSLALIFETFLVTNLNYLGLIALNLDRAMLTVLPSAGFLLFASCIKREN